MGGEFDIVILTLKSVCPWEARMYTQRHANFSPVRAGFPTATFSHVTAALYPRKIQFGLRLTF